jgi:hypothetical protein
MAIPPFMGFLEPPKPVPKRSKATAQDFLNSALTPDVRMNTDEVCNYFQENV